METNVKAIIHRCYATPSDQANDTSAFDIITDGCPQGDLVNINNQTFPELRFSFAAFYFTASSSSAVYLHCQTRICLTGQGNCNPSCGGIRKRRSVDEQELKYFKIGPIHVDPIQEDDKLSVPVEIIRMSDIQDKTKDVVEDINGSLDDEDDGSLTEKNKMFLIAYNGILSLVTLFYLGYRHYDHVHRCRNN